MCDDIMMMSLPPKRGFFASKIKIEKSCVTETDILWWLRKKITVRSVNGSKKYKPLSKKDHFLRHLGLREKKKTRVYRGGGEGMDPQ